MYIIRNLREKAAEVKGAQLTERNKSLIIDWITENGGDVRPDPDDPVSLLIKKGRCIVNEGDWVLQGSAGDFNCCTTIVKNKLYDDVTKDY